MRWSAFLIRRTTTISSVISSALSRSHRRSSETISWRVCCVASNNHKTSYALNSSQPLKHGQANDSAPFSDYEPELHFWRATIEKSQFNSHLTYQQARSSKRNPRSLKKYDYKTHVLEIDDLAIIWYWQWPLGNQRNRRIPFYILFNFKRRHIVRKSAAFTLQFFMQMTPMHNARRRKVTKYCPCCFKVAYKYVNMQPTTNYNVMVKNLRCLNDADI